MQKIVPLFVCMMAFHSCSVFHQNGTATPGSEPLFLYRWDLTQIDGLPYAGENAPYLLFTSGETMRVTGFGGCNILTGTFALSGVDSIAFGPIASTMMACAENGTELLFMARLEQANTWRIQNGSLELMHDGMVILSFTGVTLQIIVETASMSLNGIWELNYLPELRVPLSEAFLNGMPTLLINMPNTTATGNGGCNSYSADIKLKDNALTFGPIAATKMYCENTAEYLYFGNLNKVTHWQMANENELTLLAGEQLLLRFQKK